MATKTPTQPTMDIVGAAKSIGETIVALQVSNDRTVSLTDTLQENAKSLREAGVKFGKSVKTCTWRQTISDTIVALCHDKKAQKTCMNYVTSFVKAVNEGTAFSLSDSKGTAKNKGKGGKANESTSDVEKMVAALLNVWKMSDVASDVLIQIETTMADGTTLIDAISDVLKFHGEDLPAE